jgi:hypothetical protein
MEQYLVAVKDGAKVMARPVLNEHTFTYLGYGQFKLGNFKESPEYNKKRIVYICRGYAGVVKVY